MTTARNTLSSQTSFANNALVYLVLCETLMPHAELAGLEDAHQLDLAFVLHSV